MNRREIKGEEFINHVIDSPDEDYVDCTFRGTTTLAIERKSGRWGQDGPSLVRPTIIGPGRSPEGKGGAYALRSYPAGQDPDDYRSFARIEDPDIGYADKAVIGGWMGIKGGTIHNAADGWIFTTGAVGVQIEFEKLGHYKTDHTDGIQTLGFCETAYFAGLVFRGTPGAPEAPSHWNAGVFIEVARGPVSNVRVLGCMGERLGHGMYLWYDPHKGFEYLRPPKRCMLAGNKFRSILGAPFVGNFNGWQEQGSNNVELEASDR